LGCEGILPEFSQLSRKKSNKNHLQKMSIRAPFFSNQSMLGAIFAQIFREFVKVRRDFSRILWDFAQILWDFARIL